MTNYILSITASAQGNHSVSSQLNKLLVTGMVEQDKDAILQRRDLNDSELTLLNSAWVEANFTADDERSDKQKQILNLSDSYVDELQQSNILVISTPIYNFSVPAALKAYIDLICRAKLTFAYTANGPVGLLNNKQAYVIITSGGVPLNSPVDFATPYIKQVLHFIGISEVTIIDAAEMNADKQGKKLEQAEATIKQIIQNRNKV